MFYLKISVCVSFLFITACNIRSLPPGYTQNTLSRNLSERAEDSYYKTCVFDPGYRIVHFPMYHRPADTQNLSQNHPNYELVIRSQFQLLHTLIDYNRNGSVAVFDEHITIDLYNQDYYNRLSRGEIQQDTFIHPDGTSFYIHERQATARVLFGNGFPTYYEWLSVAQKAFLWYVGASKTLYLLGEISQLYKVISPQNMDAVKGALNNDYSQANYERNRQWVFDFRERMLVEEVNQFYRWNFNYQGLVFIAYGRDHDFSDDFYGYSFQSGHSFCLNWIPQNFNILP